MSVLFIFLGFLSFLGLIVVLANYLVIRKEKEDNKYLFVRDVFKKEFMKLKDNVLVAEKGILKEIEKVKLELKLIPDNETFSELKKIKQKLLEELIEKHKEKVRKEIDKFIKAFPVIIDTDLPKSSLQKAVKNKDLIKMYKLYVKEQFGKDDFVFLFNVNELKEFIDNEISPYKYASFFKHKIPIVGDWGASEFYFIRNYLDFLNAKNKEENS